VRGIGELSSSIKLPLVTISHLPQGNLFYRNHSMIDSSSLLDEIYLRRRVYCMKLREFKPEK